MPELGIGVGSEGTTIEYLNTTKSRGGGIWTMPEDGTITSVAWYNDPDGSSIADLRFGVYDVYEGGADWPDNVLGDDATIENVADNLHWDDVGISDVVVSNGTKVCHGIIASVLWHQCRADVNTSRYVWWVTAGSYAGGLGDFGDPPSWPDNHAGEQTAYFTYTVAGAALGDNILRSFATTRAANY